MQEEFSVTPGKAAARVAAILVTAAWTFAWRVPAASGQPVPDDFDSPTTNAFWRFDDAIGDCSLVMDGTHALINVGTSGPHEITPFIVGVPRLLQPALDRDFEIEAKFDNPPAAPVQSQGIIVQQDNDTVLHFGMSSLPGFPPGYALHAVFSDIGGATGAVYHASLPAQPPPPSYMRVKRSVNQWTFSTSHDGTLWTTAATFTCAMQVTEVGLFAGNSGNNPPFTSRVDYFDVLERFGETSADISVTKSVDIERPNVGDTVEYTIVASNAGPYTADFVGIEDLLPEGVTFQSSVAPPGTVYTSSNGLWAIPQFTRYETRQLLLTATVDSGVGGSAITNGARLAYITPERDENPQNDRGVAVIDVPLVDLQVVSKTVSDDAPREGDEIRYAIDVFNAGPDTATGVRIQDVLPAGLTFVRAVMPPGTTYSNGVWNAGTFPQGSGKLLYIDARVNARTAGRGITNTASVLAVDQEESRLDNNSRSASLLVRERDVTVMVFGDPEPHGTSVPLGYGSNTVIEGTVITNTVTSPADVSNGTRYVCTGWRYEAVDLPGDAGPGTSVVFAAEMDMFLTWFWQTEYWLELIAYNGIITNGVPGWKTAGFMEDLFPDPNDGYRFDHWETNGIGAGTASPLHVAMNGPVTVEAVFEPLFMEIEDIHISVVHWVTNRQTGTLFADLLVSNDVESAKSLSEPYWYVAESNAQYWLMYPDGIETNSGHPYVDITIQVSNALRAAEDENMRLDPGETVIVYGIEFFSMDRSIPHGYVMALWADPPSPAVDPGAMDTDRDGIPNDWEVRTGVLDPRNPFDAVQDLDGDGMSNIEEYHADTHPGDVASVLRLLGADPGVAGVRLRWQGGREVKQYLQSAGALAGPWQTVLTNAPPTPPRVNIQLPPVGGTPVYYRLRVNER
jgi:uncharacterized repeat protein (TIGR01451 family)